MALKYTILKVTLQIFSKVRKSERGFTLIELIVGLSIMLIVSGLAMNALVEANAGFTKDKRNIDSNQNMSVILEMIGNDIKQAGENISDNNFPTIEFTPATASETNLKSGSSKIIVRRALIAPLTLCERININQAFTTTSTPLAVADNTAATVAISANCNVATSSSPLSIYRVPPTVTTPTTYYPPTTATNPYPATRLALTLPLALRNLRDYRCEIDDPNPTTAYDSTANAAQDFCGTPTATLEKTRVAISNINGQFLILNQTGETADSGNTADPITPPVKKYQILINNDFATGDIAIANNLKNRAVEYPIGSPIYVIEERVYTLTSNGYFQLSINGQAPQTLIKKIENFRVSARIYTNSTDQIVVATPAANICTDVSPFATQPTSSTIDNPKYICKFNYFTGVATTDQNNWKTLAGLKVELQAKYDSTGGASETSTNPGDIAQVTRAKEKLSAKAEFFPRNVLSR